MGRPHIYLFGLGFKPFTSEEEVLLKKVSRIYLFPKTLEILKENPLYSSLYEEISYKIEKLKNLEDLKEILARNEGEIALLASGDPLFFGLAETLVRLLPKEDFTIYPDLSTLQILSARLKIPFYKIKPLSFHGRPLAKEVFFREVQENPYLFVFTDPKNSPQLMAKLLFEAGFEGLSLYIGERLGTPEERIYGYSVREVISLDFKEPNVLLIENPNWGLSPILGLTTEEIGHKSGLITKDEVRAIVLHKLRPPKRGVIWDIGAGSGSVSLELARLSRDLKVFAIEKEPSQLSLLWENKSKFNLPNLEIVAGEAPFVLSELPKPQRVFLGGSGGRLEEIFEFLKGIPELEIIVATFVLMKNLEVARTILEGEYSISISQIQVNTTKALGADFYLKAENPVFILQAKRLR